MISHLISKLTWLHLLLAALLAGLLVHSYNGYSSRFIADDFCLAADAHAQGAVGATVHRYYTWTGRFAQFFLQGFLEPLGPGFASILPTLLIGMWLAATVWLLYEINPYVMRLRRPQLACLLLATTIVLATVDSPFSTIQSLYWISGTIGYTLPLIVLTGLLAFLVHTATHTPEGDVSIRSLLIVFPIAFTNGGFSETSTTFQAAIFLLLGVLVFITLPPPRRRAALLLLGAGLVGSLLALGIMMTAPGNALRQVATPINPLISRNPPLPILVIESLKAGASSLASIIGLFSPIQLLVTLIIATLVCYQLRDAKPSLRLYPARVRGLIGTSALVAFGLNVICMAPSIYGAGIAPSERIYIIPQFVVVLTTVFWGALVGLSAKKRESNNILPTHLAMGARVFLATLVLLGPLAIIRSNLAKSPDFRTYAADWDARDSQIRAAAEQRAETVVVEPLRVDLANLANLETAGADPKHWVNSCTARYYGIEALIVEETGSG